MSKVLDLLIVGGSAAGATAAIYARRRNLNFKVISLDFGGEVAKSGVIENYLGFLKIDGIELSAKFKEHLKSVGVEAHLEWEVEEIKKRGNIFKTKTKKRGRTYNFFSKTVLLTTGATPKHLNIPGEKEFYAKGVSYCTVCDGPLFDGKITVTIGGGNSALESAIMLSEIAKQHYLITTNPDMNGDGVLIDKVKKLKNVQIIYNSQTAKILGDSFVTGLDYKDKQSGKSKHLRADGIFIHIGLVPNSQMAFGVKKNKFGEIIVDSFCRTSLPGFFAAGDVTNIPYKQISIAVGQGTCSALAIVDYLNKLKS